MMAEGEQVSRVSAVGRLDPSRDELCAAKVLDLLAQIPLQSTFGNIETKAGEVRELREWLEEFLP